MGKRGPAPKPTALKVFEGEKDKSKLQTGEIEPAQAGDEFLKPPRGMAASAKKKWVELVEVLKEVPGLLTTMDRDTLIQYCQAWGIQTDAKKWADKWGWENDRGQQSAEAMRYWKATETVIKLMKELGLTPAARLNVKPSELSPNKTEKDKKASYLG